MLTTSLMASAPLIFILKGLCRGFCSSSTIDLAVKQIKQEGRKILVLAGAGLSTPSGVPDFRTPGSGLYNNLQKYKLPYPEAIFELQYFAQNPKPFLDWARTIYPGEGDIKPNIGHYFVRLLETKGKLLRMYTQNIDGLERLAGISNDNLVEAHGGFSTASCIKCGAKKDSNAVREEIMAGKEPRCSKCQGLVKPDITFFGEMLPPRFSLLSEEDTANADMLLVVGTSLAVYPFAGLAEMVGDGVPRLLINREAVGTIGLRGEDTLLLGDVVQRIGELISRLGWQADYQRLINESSSRTSQP